LHKIRTILQLNRHTLILAFHQKPAIREKGRRQLSCWFSSECGRESAHARRSLESRTKLSACYMLGRQRKVIVQGNKLEFGGALKAYLTSFMVPVPAGGFENSGLLSFCQSARAEGLLQLACRVKFGGEVRLRGTPASAVYIWGGRKWLPTRCLVMKGHVPGIQRRCIYMMRRVSIIIDYMQIEAFLDFFPESATSAKVTGLRRPYSGDRQLEFSFNLKYTTTVPERYVPLMHLPRQGLVKEFISCILTA